MRAWVVVVLLLASSAAADPPVVGLDDARTIMFGSAAPRECTDVACLIAHRFADDPKAAALAAELYRANGSIAGVGETEMMDGGYRGKILLVPQLPIREYRVHLAWVVDALGSYDAFFGELFAQSTAPNYRWHGLGVRFMRSVGKHTPSAYADHWTVFYNVAGSLLVSADAVRDLLFHELFHDNDEVHGDWSAKTLATDYDAIVKRCGVKVACLAPFAPTDTMVRGGTFYAFQQNNGVPVHEYAAEIAVRYFDEQRQMLHDGKLAKRAFKCGPAENARSWKALVDEFFAGRDLVPAC